MGPASPIVTLREEERTLKYLDPPKEIMFQEQLYFGYTGDFSLKYSKSAEKKGSVRFQDAFFTKRSYTKHSLLDDTAKEFIFSISS